MYILDNEVSQVTCQSLLGGLSAFLFFLQVREWRAIDDGQKVWNKQPGFLHLYFFFLNSSIASRSKMHSSSLFMQRLVIMCRILSHLSHGNCFPQPHVFNVLTICFFWHGSLRFDFSAIGFSVHFLYSEGKIALMTK